MRLYSYHENLKQILAYTRSQNRLSLIEEEVLLAAYLQYFSRRKDTRALCKRMLMEAGSFYNLVHLPPHHLEQHFKINDILATAISNIGVLSDYIQMDTKPKQPLKILPEYYHHLKPYFSASNFEKTIIICLNKQCGWIATEVFTLYDPRQTPAAAALVLEIAQKYRAKQVVLAHNHPNTRVHALAPSVADIAATNRIRDVLAAYGIILREHVLVAYDGCISLMHRMPLYLDENYCPGVFQPDYIFDPENYD